MTLTFIAFQHSTCKVEYLHVQVFFTFSDAIDKHVQVRLVLIVGSEAMCRDNHIAGVMMDNMAYIHTIYYRHRGIVIFMDVVPRSITPFAYRERSLCRPLEILQRCRREIQIEAVVEINRRVRYGIKRYRNFRIVVVFGEGAILEHFRVNLQYGRIKRHIAEIAHDVGFKPQVICHKLACEREVVFNGELTCRHEGSLVTRFDHRFPVNILICIEHQVTSIFRIAYVVTIDKSAHIPLFGGRIVNGVPIDIDNLNHRAVCTRLNIETIAHKDSCKATTMRHYNVQVLVCAVVHIDIFNIQVIRAIFVNISAFRRNMDIGNFVNTIGHIDTWSPFCRFRPKRHTQVSIYRRDLHRTRLVRTHCKRIGHVFVVFRNRDKVTRFRILNIISVSRIGSRSIRSNHTRRSIDTALDHCSPIGQCIIVSLRRTCSDRALHAIRSFIDGSRNRTRICRPICNCKITKNPYRASTQGIIIGSRAIIREMQPLSRKKRPAHMMSSVEKGNIARCSAVIAIFIRNMHRMLIERQSFRAP